MVKHRRFSITEITAIVVVIAEVIAAINTTVAVTATATSYTAVTSHRQESLTLAVLGNCYQIVLLTIRCTYHRSHEKRNVWLVYECSNWCPKQNVITVGDFVC